MAAPIDLEYLFSGRWLVQNSPANRVPSHGTTLFGSAYAIDFVPVDGAGRTAPVSVRSLIRSEPPESFPGFGHPVVAPVIGIVAVVHDVEPDHAAHRGLPSVRYALTQRGRMATGWRGLAGNHVLIDTGDAVVAVCHLQRGSVVVSAGERVRVGTPLGRCGNSGNSTEPHVHLQAIDSASVERAAAVPITFRGRLPRNGEIVVPGP